MHDYEPHWKNHVVPTYGLYSRFYFGRMLKSCSGEGEKYSSFKKNYGPPHYHYNPRYMPLEHNDYLKKKGVALSEIRMHTPKRQLELAPAH